MTPKNIDLREADMPIPHLPEARSGLWEQLEKEGGKGERQDIVDALAERFQISQAEMEQRDPTGGKTFAHRVDSAVAQSRRVGWMEPVAVSGRGIWELTSVYFSDVQYLNGSRLLDMELK